MTRLSITGAGGFLGRAMVRKALDSDVITQVFATDLVSMPDVHAKLTTQVGDLSDPAVTTALVEADVVIHLAATLGGAAEADPEAARHLNLDATLDLIAALTAAGGTKRLVFASSLAVLGTTANSRAPSMIYGAHKAMAEIAIETATRRGEIDGISLRPGGIVARPGSGSSLKSAFLSRVFWAIRTGQDMVLPVSSNATTWLASVCNVRDNFLHAALAPSLGDVRSLTLPMIRVEFGALVECLHQAFPSSPSKISYDPQLDIMRLFGTAQPLDFSDGLNAGFYADDEVRALVQSAFTNGESQ